MRGWVTPARPRQADRSWPGQFPDRTPGTAAVESACRYSAVTPALGERRTLAEDGTTAPGTVGPVSLRT